MKNYIFGTIFSLGILATPAFTQAAALTTAQSTSLIAVVQSSPGTPASAFVNLITAFSNITTNQATSLIAVVQASPSTPATAFVDLLTSFTVDTTTTQPATPATNQAVIPTTPQSTTPVIAQTLPLASVEINDYAAGGGDVDTQNDIVMWRASILVDKGDVSIEELRLRQIGSIHQNELSDFRLYFDEDTQFSSAVPRLDSNGYVTFSGNIRLNPGRHYLKLLGSVVAVYGGSMSFQLRRYSDIKVIDVETNQSVIPIQFRAATGSMFNVRCVPPSGC
ncbi:MAG TPA: hypothetical protein VJI70_00135 [Candidatus Paceibacterota bacterium]